MIISLLKNSYCQKQIPYVEPSQYEFVHFEFICSKQSLKTISFNDTTWWLHTYDLQAFSNYWILCKIICHFDKDFRYFSFIEKYYIFILSAPLLSSLPSWIKKNRTKLFRANKI